MNDLDAQDWNHTMNQDHHNDRFGGGNRENRQKHRPHRRRGGRLFALGGFVVLVSGLSLGAFGQYSQQQQVMAMALQERDFVPSVRVATIGASPDTVSVTLPGTTAAFATANVFARATGYIAKRNVDIGDRVAAGDLLAQLAVPELDDQISQNEATLNQLKSALDQAEASRKLAEMTWGRDEPLVKKGWVTLQQGDVDLQTLKAREAAVAVAQHNVTSQESLVKQLHQNRDYASVVAPFDGVITQRNVDLGSLVQGNATSGTFMFEIMQEDVIRVWVYVPQDAAFGVAPGIDAIVRVPELPDRAFTGTVTRIADALQAGTRTLLTEIDIPNSDGVLTAGTYCAAELHIPRKTPSLSVPADAIIFNRDGMQVAVVSDGKAEIRKVRVKRDLGTRVEVDSGIKAGDQVILNPPVTLVDGSRVQLRPEPANGI
ncbi:MAG TPA: efflux RND transporter periplasmic adaptor subunit [Xanthobacteraceae bacterium]|jgi:RND family efflux transporter MFP subunit